MTTRRISASTMVLLERLCAPNAHIAFLDRQGNFYFCIGQSAETPIYPRQMDSLVKWRLIARNRVAEFADYVITDIGRDAVREHVRTRCEDAGHIPQQNRACECGAVQGVDFF